MIPMMGNFMGGIKPVLGGAAPLGGMLSGASFVDSNYRHGELGTFDTWGSLALVNNTASGDVRVPMRAKYLAAISATAAYDSDATGTVHTLYRLTGSGLARGGYYRGIASGYGLVLSGTPAGGGSGVIIPTTTMLTGIPVIGGNDITIDGAMDGDDIGTVTAEVALLFSDKPLGTVVDFDVRTSAPQASVHTRTALNAIAGTAYGDFRVPSYASKAQIATCTAYSLDTNTTVRALSAYEFSGSGFAQGGSFRYVTGGGAGTVPNTNNILPLVSPLDLFPAPVGVVGGNDISVQASGLGEDTGDVQFGTMLLYH